MVAVKKTHECRRCGKRAYYVCEGCGERVCGDCSVGLPRWLRSGGLDLSRACVGDCQTKMIERVKASRANCDDED